MNIALIIAGGIGSRMNNYIPKQFINVDDKPILIYTLDVFEAHEEIDAIIISVLDKWEEVVWAYSKQFDITKLKWVVRGGSSNQESIFNGLKELQKWCDPNDTVMVHAANRPMISTEMISDSLKTYKKYGSAVAATPCIELAFLSEDGITGNEYVPREQLFRTQLPQTYSLERFVWAHNMAKEKGIKEAGSSCVLMHELGEKTFFSQGSPNNIKITTNEDLIMFRALLNAKNSAQ